MRVIVKGEDLAAALEFARAASGDAECAKTAPGVLLDMTPDGDLRVTASTYHRMHSYTAPVSPAPREIDPAANMALSAATSKALAKALGTKKLQKATLAFMEFKAREVTLRHLNGAAVTHPAAETWGENARAFVAKPFPPRPHVCFDLDQVAAFAEIAAKMGAWGHVRISAREGENRAHLSAWTETGRENSVIALAADVPLKMPAPADWQEAFRACYVADALAALKAADSHAGRARRRRDDAVFAIRQDGPGGPAEFYLPIGDAAQNARAVIIPTRGDAPKILPDLRRGADFSKAETVKAAGRAIRARETEA